MILSSALTADGACYRNLIADTIDPEVIQTASGLFDIYHERGTILAGSMQEDTWVMTNERDRVTLRFLADGPAFRKHAAKWLDCPPDTFTSCLKSFILIRMGDMELASLRDLCNDIRSLVQSPDPFVCSLHYPYHTARFLRLLPGISPSREEVAASLEEDRGQERERGSQRLLADFTAYLKFHDSFKETWSSADTKDRLFFFPLWLWWNLTTILPLRPTEFVLTPYDCLVTDGPQEKIRIRRTHLKGGRKKISYTIDGDFDIHAYPVPEGIASMIRWYRKALEGYGYRPGRYLFSLCYYQDYVKAHTRSHQDTIYLYRHLKKTLDIYYRHFPQAGAGQPEPVRLGDTRHLAMISLIISGGSPVVCRERAGHDDIKISSHYYSNMASLVECATYELYRKAAQGDRTATVSRSPSYDLKLPARKVRVEGGWCGSEKFSGHSVEDCIRSVSDHGELGLCENCPFFCPDSQGMLFHFEDTAYNRERVKTDSWFLMFMTEAVRHGRGTAQDLSRAILRLQNSCHDYQSSILQSLKQKEVLPYGTSQKK